MASEPETEREDEPSRSRRGLVLRLVGIAVAAVLIAVVIKTVPWSDSLTLRTATEAQAEVYQGTIDGSWRGARVEFRFDDDQTAGPILAEGGWTANLVVEGAQVSVDRDAGRLRLGEQELEVQIEFRPGMPRAFSDLDTSAIPLALGLLFMASLFIVTRWWRLLLIAGCPTRWFDALRLTYVGLFFNTVLPGSTGGDLVRAYVVVRGHPERRAAALTTVGADRVLGLLGMAILSAIAIWSSDSRFADLRPWVLLALLGLVGGLLAVVNPWLRRLVRFDAILSKLPQGRRLAKIDDAVRSYAQHPGPLLFTLALSMGNHLCSTACCHTIGHAFGDTHGFLDYLCVVTVANTVSSLPLSPGGLGVGEVAFGTLLSLAGGLYMIGVATSFVYRLALATLGLGGGLVLLLPGGAQVRHGYAEVRRADASPPDPST
ncbi:MAG: lysylphosphatidylglycerol synthase transmembrane domain-containing protein [Planctomycetota bacterium]|nr:lysylphosphatidylglycerol synthase transmembrane domain-containing protein [Planctomycetota bacterium]